MSLEHFLFLFIPTLTSLIVAKYCSEMKHVHIYIKYVPDYIC